MRGKLINVLGNVADLVGNYDQLDKTATALYKVTAVQDEVTDDGKVSDRGQMVKVGIIVIWFGCSMQGNEVMERLTIGTLIYLFRKGKPNIHNH